ncbi:MAG: hypothetical protein ACO1OB_12680 [Archangium sp.]
MISLVLSAVLAVTVAPECPEENVVHMGVGTQKVIRVKPGSVVHSTRSDVVLAKAVPGDMALLVGISIGRAEVIVQLGEAVLKYPVRVKSSDLGHRLVELAQFFPCDSTLELKIHKNTVELAGEASSLEEWKAAIEAVEKWPSIVVTGTLKKSVIEQTIRDANKAFLDAGYPKAKFIRVDEGIESVGGAPNDLFLIWEPKVRLAVSRPRRTKR